MAATRNQCTCAEEAGTVRQHIESMVEVSLDVIIVAVAQTIDFSHRSRKCQSNCASLTSEVKDNLLHIYAKLVDTLQSAIFTYSAPMPLVKSHELATNSFGSQYVSWSPRNQQLGTLAQTPAHQHHVLEGKHGTGIKVGCTPSKMALGKHELDEQQSQYLALDLCCRTLRNLASVLEQKGGTGQEERRGLANFDARVLELLSRVTRLVEKASIKLGALSSEGI